MECTQTSKENMKDHNMSLVGIGNTKILTNYAQKFPRYESKV